MPLTRRENLMALLAHQQAEHVSAVFVVDNFNRPHPLPLGLEGEDPLDPRIQRYLGGDVIDRLAVSEQVVRSFRTVVLGSQTLPDGRVLQTWETPLGALYRRAVPSGEAQTTFTVEFPVKRAEDYDRLCLILRDAEIKADVAAIQREGRAHLARTGEDGITYSVGPSTPIMELTRSWTGLERFVYDLQDQPERVALALKLMHQINCRHYELLCASMLGRVVVNWDDVNNLYLSRRLLQEYWVPTIRDYAAICHRYGKLFVMHTCGRLQGFIDLFAETGLDAIDWLTPPPTGDVTFAEAQGILGAGVAVMGAAEPGAMRFGSPDAVEQSLHGWLAGVDLKRNFCLLIPCPLGTPLANAARVARVLERDYGLELNREPGFPAIWEDPHTQQAG